jgi:chitodextrinase
VPVWTLFGLLYKNRGFEIVLFQDRIVQRPSYHDWIWDTQQEVKKSGNIIRRTITPKTPEITSKFPGLAHKNQAFEITLLLSTLWHALCITPNVTYQISAPDWFRRAFFFLLGIGVCVAMAPFSAFAAGSVTLAWSPSISANVAAYKIYYGLASGVYNDSISAAGSTNATITGLAEGTTYYFAATAMDALGVESQFSNETTYSVPMNSTPPLNPPDPPNGDTVPTILTPPQTQTVEDGCVVNFAARVTGIPSPSYQWFFNGNAIAGYTNRLCLSGIQASNVGAYTLVVGNAWGAVTSAPAMLNVIAPVQRRPVPAVNLMAQPGSSVGLDYCDVPGSTADWTTVATMTLSNNSQFYFDVSEPLPPQRFYRVWQTGTPGVVPSLNLNFVPAITLTGDVGSSLRLDYINVIGPTDAWVTLDTVTLTNTSQLYFDVSMLGQPARLYRIVPVP